jgi:Na+/citrate or Na+/malate symporter
MTNRDIDMMYDKERALIYLLDYLAIYIFQHIVHRWVVPDALDFLIYCLVFQLSSLSLKQSTDFTFLRNGVAEVEEFVRVHLTWCVFVSTGWTF